MRQMNIFSYSHVRYFVMTNHMKNQLYVNFYEVSICQYGGLVRGSNERVNQT